MSRPPLNGIATRSPHDSSLSIHEHRLKTRKLKPWHEWIADEMLINPRVTNAEIATKLGCSPNTVAVVRGTDAFKAYYRSRRTVHEEGVDTAVRDKLQNVIALSLDATISRLEKKQDTLPFSELNKTTEMALKALGFTSDEPKTSVVINNNPTLNAPVDMDTLREAREALQRSQQRVIDVTPNATEGRGGTASPTTPPHSPLEDLV